MRSEFQSFTCSQPGLPFLVAMHSGPCWWDWADKWEAWWGGRAVANWPSAPLEWTYATPRLMSHLLCSAAVTQETLEIHAASIHLFWSWSLLYVWRFCYDTIFFLPEFVLLFWISGCFFEPFSSRLWFFMKLGYYCYIARITSFIMFI